MVRRGWYRVVGRCNIYRRNFEFWQVFLCWGACVAAPSISLRVPLLERRNSRPLTHALPDQRRPCFSVHNAIGRDNVAVFKTFFAAVDWCETQLIRSVASYEEDGNAGSFWATSHFSRRESFK